ncbi:hypothetical protein [Actinoplanes auranticolor]|uniref:Uncharacterized protein n=1 Tax=Actinoplanes auranticolor TaxID=47988 RepID=A0A919SI45_9ACTN|nr:hypothetical protein [Actinoplanes auranticolor]GIM72421.1 hypothetical protein Aau02nite_50900 [Actinoplanes auranticolor]
MGAGPDGRNTPIRATLEAADFSAVAVIPRRARPQCPDFDLVLHHDDDAIGDDPGVTLITGIPTTEYQLYG